MSLCLLQEPVDMSGIIINIIPDMDATAPSPSAHHTTAPCTSSCPPPTPIRHTRRGILLSASASSGSGSLEGVPSPWDSGPSSPRDCGSAGGGRQRRPSWLKLRPTIQLIPGTPAAHDHLTPNRFRQASYFSYDQFYLLKILCFSDSYRRVGVLKPSTVCPNEPVLWIKNLGKQPSSCCSPGARWGRCLPRSGGCEFEYHVHQTQWCILRFEKKVKLTCASVILSACAIETMLLTFQIQSQGNELFSYCAPRQDGSGVYPQIRRL